MAVTGGVVERFKPGSWITFTVSAPVTEGRLVEATGNRRCGPASAGSLVCVGVALQTASAAEDKVGVAAEGVFMLRASGAIPAGAAVEAGAAGTVRVLTAVDAAGSFHPAAKIGRALEAIADGTDGPVRLGIH